MATLNDRAWELADQMAQDADKLQIDVHTLDCGTRVIDCGVHAPGSVETGRRLAEVCMSGLARVELLLSASFTFVNVSTDQPVAACMASQYAGWEIRYEKYFAMGSGPMRAAAGREELFNAIGHREQATVCVGALETGKLPPESVCRLIADKCGVAPNRLTLLAARTASPAGTVQIVARSLETALHKLHVLGFDLSQVDRGWGSAPIPPLADDDLSAIGRTNDAILYGGSVTLWIRSDDATLSEICARVPSCASLDYGQPFAEVFARYDHDFYRIDPMLFSPAEVTICNPATGNRFHQGRTNPDVLEISFGGAG
jgi:methenyltetrahydromethanopterin cyclohydrolase